MSSARSVLKTPQKSYKRYGVPTDADKAVVAQMVMDHPSEVSTKQVNALAVALRRPRHVIKELVERARENFVSHAEDYVRLHFETTQKAAEQDDPKALDAALRGSQWALEHMGAEGVRVVEKAGPTEKGSKILIGIKVGGIDQPTTTIALPEVSATSVEPAE
jgi:acyl-CoA reductase-like NAD-dependent aldehyde dehydrogenase